MRESRVEGACVERAVQAVPWKSIALLIVRTTFSVLAWASQGRAQSTEPAPGKVDASLQIGAARGEGSTFLIAGLAVEAPPIAIGAGVHTTIGLNAFREPLLAMVKPSGAPVTAAYGQGVAAFTSVRFAHMSGSTEMAIVGRAGSARLDSVSSVVINDIGAWAAFVDARVEFDWYAQDLSSDASSPGPLMAIVQAYGGVRHDQRFHRAGDLSTFNDPTGRWFLGSVVNLLRVRDPGSNSARQMLLTIGCGVDYETALRTTYRLPSGFEVLVRGNVNLVRVLRHRPARLTPEDRHLPSFVARPAHDKVYNDPRDTGGFTR
jgi:hypothetical protein